MIPSLLSLSFRSCAPRVLGAAAVALLGLAGCLDVPPGLAPMCHSSNDCDRSHGEVCEEGVCWGNPPPGPFAAVVSPPSTRSDLVSRELPQLSIPDFGWMGDLALEAPVLLSGKLVAFCAPPMTCDPTPLPGTITVTRPSQFHGGPGFRAVANVAAGASFAMPVRRTQPDDDEYTVTILPDTTLQANGPSAAQLVPPRRLHLAVIDNTTTQEFDLGGADLPSVTGHLQDSAGRGLANYRVSALGHWDPNEPVTEVSTVDYTDSTGMYAITLSDELVGSVELIARPVAARPGDVAPVAATIHIVNVDATTSSVHDVRGPTNLGNPVPLTLQIQGVDAGGGTANVPGAQVVVTGTSALTGSLTSFTMSDVEVSDNSGQVTLKLLDGAAFTGAYRMSITPPAGSPLGAMFDQRATLDMAPQIRLGARIALRGTLLGPDGKPLAKAAVTVRPSLRFLWTLDTAPQAFVAAIPVATASTDPDGSYLLRVDPNIADVWGHYDLIFEPPAGTRAPSYVFPDYEIPRFGTHDVANIDPIQLPDPAFVHGRITGPDGRSVEDAELKLYLVSTQLTLCSQVQHAPTSCPIPAQLRARNTSDDEGTVRLILPR
jgi:hypothetical protein